MRLISTAVQSTARPVGSRVELTVGYSWRFFAAWAFLAVSMVLPLIVFGLNNPPGVSDPSEADLDVTLTVPTMYRISGIENLSFGTYTGNGALSLDEDVCVWTNASGGAYRVTARGDGASFAFVVTKSGDTSKTIPYTVRWNNTSGTSGNQALLADTTSSNMTGANTVSIGCSTGPANTANFQVSFSESALLGSVSGTYTGVLSLIISAPL